MDALKAIPTSDRFTVENAQELMREMNRQLMRLHPANRYSLIYEPMANILSMMSPEGRGINHAIFQTAKKLANQVLTLDITHQATFLLCHSPKVGEMLEPRYHIWEFPIGTSGTEMLAQRGNHENR